MGSRFKHVVYVAGPISKGCLASNVMQAHAAGMALLKAGVAAIVPHGSCFWGNETVSTREGDHFTPEAFPAGTTHDDWLGMDLAIVSRCDAVLRLPGESVGADKEVAEAKRLGKPVFYHLWDVVAWADTASLWEETLERPVSCEGGFHARALRALAAYPGTLACRADEGAPIRLFAQCADLFAPRSVHAELITPENLGELERAVADAKAAHPLGWNLHGDALFCCRMQKRRPMVNHSAMFVAELRPLFDACGPEVTP